MLTDTVIENWAHRETENHFKNYWKNPDGTELAPAERTGEMLADFLIESTTYQVGLITGAKAFRDNLIY